MNATRPWYNEPVDDIGELMTVAEFRAACQVGKYVDYDGHGHPVRDGMVASRIVVKPSRCRMTPPDATHVIWYNR